jgi:death on curing protein
MSVAYLEIADFLLIAEAVLGIPAERLALSDPLVGLAEVALDAPAEAFEGVDFHPERSQKAAILFSRLVHGHPLSVGNTRTAYLCLIEFLARNGRVWRLPRDQAEEDEVVAAIALLVAGELPETEFVDWVGTYLASLTKKE